MAQSSDALVKREIADKVGRVYDDYSLIIYPESSKDDKLIFGEHGGLTFGVDGIEYGSCDACWAKAGDWSNPYDNRIVPLTPIIAIEATDALNTGSSGDAQYQRFHHALGAVKSGIIGVYYLRNGSFKIQPDLYGMAVSASKIEKGTYLILNDLDEVKKLVYYSKYEYLLRKFINDKLQEMEKIYSDAFRSRYKDLDDFARKRSTIIKDSYIIKYAGRMKRNFTDGDQRAGHIAVGEMYLTKYLLSSQEKPMLYLWPRMLKQDIIDLDRKKTDDKEWKLLRHEPGVEIITLDDLIGVPESVMATMQSIRNKPLKGSPLMDYHKAINIIDQGLRNGSIEVDETILSRIRQEP